MQFPSQWDELPTGWDHRHANPLIATAKKSAPHISSSTPQRGAAADRSAALPTRDRANNPYKSGTLSTGEGEKSPPSLANVAVRTGRDDVLRTPALRPRVMTARGPHTRSIALLFAREGGDEHRC